MSDEEEYAAEEHSGAEQEEQEEDADAEGADPSLAAGGGDASAAKKKKRKKKKRKKKKAAAAADGDEAPAQDGGEAAAAAGSPQPEPAEGASATPGSGKKRKRKRKKRKKSAAAAEPAGEGEAQEPEQPGEEAGERPAAASQEEDGEGEEEEEPPVKRRRRRRRVPSDEEGGGTAEGEGEGAPEQAGEGPAAAASEEEGTPVKRRRRRRRARIEGEGSGEGEAPAGGEEDNTGGEEAAGGEEEAPARRRRRAQSEDSAAGGEADEGGEREDGETPARHRKGGGVGRAAEAQLARLREFLEGRAAWGGCGAGGLHELAARATAGAQAMLDLRGAVRPRALLVFAAAAEAALRGEGGEQEEEGAGDAWGGILRALLRRAADGSSPSRFLAAVAGLAVAGYWAHPDPAAATREGGWEPAPVPAIEWARLLHAHRPRVLCALAAGVASFLWRTGPGPPSGPARVAALRAAGVRNAVGLGETLWEAGRGRGPPAEAALALFAAAAAPLAVCTPRRHFQSWLRYARAALGSSCLSLKGLARAASALADVVRFARAGWRGKEGTDELHEAMGAVGTASCGLAGSPAPPPDGWLAAVEAVGDLGLAILRAMQEEESYGVPPAECAGCGGRPEAAAAVPPFFWRREAAPEPAPPDVGELAGPYVQFLHRRGGPPGLQRVWFSGLADLAARQAQEGPAAAAGAPSWPAFLAEAVAMFGTSPSPHLRTREPALGAFAGLCRALLDGRPAGLCPPAAAGACAALLAVLQPEADVPELPGVLEAGGAAACAAAAALLTAGEGLGLAAPPPPRTAAVLRECGRVLRGPAPAWEADRLASLVAGRALQAALLANGAGEGELAAAACDALLAASDRPAFRWGDLAPLPSPESVAESLAGAEPPAAAAAAARVLGLLAALLQRDAEAVGDWASRRGGGSGAADADASGVPIAGPERTADLLVGLSGTTRTAVRLGLELPSVAGHRIRAGAVLFRSPSTTPEGTLVGFRATFDGDALAHRTFQRHPDAPESVAIFLSEPALATLRERRSGGVTVIASAGSPPPPPPPPGEEPEYGLRLGRAGDRGEFYLWTSQQERAPPVPSDAALGLLVAVGPPFRAAAAAGEAGVLDAAAAAFRAWGRAAGAGGAPGLIRATLALPHLVQEGREPGAGDGDWAEDGRLAARLLDAFLEGLGARSPEARAPPRALGAAFAAALCSDAAGSEGADAARAAVGEAVVMPLGGALLPDRPALTAALLAWGIEKTRAGALLVDVAAAEALILNLDGAPAHCREPVLCWRHRPAPEPAAARLAELFELAAGRAGPAADGFAARLLQAGLLARQPAAVEAAARDAARLQRAARLVGPIALPPTAASDAAHLNAELAREADALFPEGTLDAVLYGWQPFGHDAGLEVGGEVDPFAPDTLIDEPPYPVFGPVLELQTFNGTSPAGLHHVRAASRRLAVIRAGLAWPGPLAAPRRAALAALVRAHAEHLGAWAAVAAAAGEERDGPAAAVCLAQLALRYLLRRAAVDARFGGDAPGEEDAAENRAFAAELAAGFAAVVAREAGVGEGSLAAAAALHPATELADRAARAAAGALCGEASADGVAIRAEAGPPAAEAAAARAALEAGLAGADGPQLAAECEAAVQAGLSGLAEFAPKRHAAALADAARLLARLVLRGALPAPDAAALGGRLAAAVEGLARAARAAWLVAGPGLPFAKTARLGIPPPARLAPALFLATAALAGATAEPEAPGRAAAEALGRRLLAFPPLQEAVRSGAAAGGQGAGGPAPHRLPFPFLARHFPAPPQEAV